MIIAFSETDYLNPSSIPFFPNAILYEFENGNEAEHYILYRLQKEQKINLIISDINHPGLRGDKLVNRIRKWEGTQGCVLKRLL